MSKFAYLDKGNVLHIVKEKETAVKYSKNGKVVETDILASGGYPIVEGEEIIVYNETTMKLDAGSPETLEAKKYPQLAALYQQCK